MTRTMQLTDRHGGKHSERRCVDARDQGVTGGMDYVASVSGVETPYGGGAGRWSARLFPRRWRAKWLAQPPTVFWCPVHRSTPSSSAETRSSWPVRQIGHCVRSARNLLARVAAQGSCAYLSTNSPSLRSTAAPTHTAYRAIHSGSHQDWLARPPKLRVPAAACTPLHRAAAIKEGFPQVADLREPSHCRDDRI
jgi:hypothetical protein